MADFKDKSIVVRSNFYLTKYHKDLLYENVGQGGMSDWLKRKIQEDFDVDINLNERQRVLKNEISTLDEGNKGYEEKRKEKMFLLKIIEDRIQKKMIKDERLKQLQEEYGEKEIKFIRQKVEIEENSIMNILQEFRRTFDKRIKYEELVKVVECLKN